MNDNKTQSQLADEKLRQTLSWFLSPAQFAQVMGGLDAPDTCAKVLKWAGLIEACPEMAEASELDDEAQVILKYDLPFFDIALYVMGIERIEEDVATEYDPEVWGAISLGDGVWRVAQVFLGEALEYRIWLDKDFEPVSFKALKQQLSVSEL